MSNIEDDVKILEKFKNNEMQRDKLERDNRCGGWKIGDIYKHLELNTAIEHILQDYARQKQINEEHQKLNGELRERVKELEQNIEKQKKLTMLAETITDESIKETLIEFEKEYISKQKIKEKFEKIQLLYENNLKEVDLKEVQKVDGKIFEGIRLKAQRDLTRELLQESEGEQHE